MTKDNTLNTTTIRVSNEFKARLGNHGRWGERFEDILIRLLGKDFEETATGDKDTRTYSQDDVDSRKTKKTRMKKGFGRGYGYSDCPCLIRSSWPWRSHTHGCSDDGRLTTHGGTPFGPPFFCLATHAYHRRSRNDLVS